MGGSSHFITGGYNMSNNFETSEKWTPEDDLALLETVLYSIKRGRSIMSGCREFEELTKGRRTAQASKFRFHVKLKEEYRNLYEEAVLEGKLYKVSKKNRSNNLLKELKDIRDRLNEIIEELESD